MIRIFTLLLMPGILALAIACGDDDGGDQPVPTPTVDAPAATSTPAPDGEADGADGFRQFLPAFPEALDAGDASLGIRPADRVLEAIQAQTGQQVGQVTDAILDGDDLADLEAAVTNVAHHDPVFGFALDGDHDLAAVGQVAGLGEVVQRCRRERPRIECLEEPEHLHEGRVRPLGEGA